MSVNPSQPTHYLPDGSVVRCTLETADPTVATIFAADLAGRVRRSRQAFTGHGTDHSLAGYARFARDEPGGHRSTVTHALPTGEVTVSIDASDEGSHGYLRYLVEGAVAAAHVLNIEAVEASLLATLLIGTGLALVSVNLAVLGAPFFGAGAAFAIAVVLYGLAARGVPVSLSKPPEPFGPYR